LSKIGTFEPYYKPYKKWQNDYLNALKYNIEVGKKITAISLDIRNFYHGINIFDLIDGVFLKEFEFTEHEIFFNSIVFKFISSWSDNSNEIVYKNCNRVIDGFGLPIGVSFSKILANFILKKWDDLIVDKVKPVFYGRYVDDMLIAVESDSIKKMSDFFEYLNFMFGCNYIIEDGYDFYIKFEDIFPKNKFFINQKKSKIMILSGSFGLSVIDKIKNDMAKNSSEHRLLPTEELFEKSISKNILNALNSSSDKAKSLHNIDVLSFSRSNWVLYIKYIETLAKDLPVSEWGDVKKRFYEYIESYMLGTENIFSHVGYIERILGLFIQISDWKCVEGLLRKIKETLYCVREKELKIFISGENSAANIFCLNNNSDNSFFWIFDVYKLVVKHTFLKYFKGGDSGGYNFLSDFLFKNYDIDLKNSSDEIKKIIDSDLAFIPYKDFLIEGELEIVKKINNRKILKQYPIDLGVSGIYHFLDIFSENFKGKKLKSDWCPLALAFPTRSIDLNDLTSLIELENLKSNELNSIIYALTGESLCDLSIVNFENESSDNLKTIKIGKEKKEKVTVALTNILTTEDSYNSMCANQPQLTFKRYEQIARVVNDILNLDPKPEYAIFPEVSIPLKWAKRVSETLRHKGISSIIGTEYIHDNDTVFSEAYLTLKTEFSGGTAWINIRQPKLLPAVGEEYRLHSLHAKKWKKFDRCFVKRNIYIHNGFHFGVLICSELQNSKDRIAFQGNIDGLFILSWNRDLDTFSDLIKSAALDIHSYIILVNNRAYGDSRVRVPSKEAWARDLARLKGGNNDYVVSVSLDLLSLRQFHSRGTRWANEKDKFKPTPEGFEIRSSRKVIPK